MGDYFSKFFDTSDFPARWYCGNWSEFLGWLHIVSDVVTFGAYFAIPAVLIYFARKRDDFSFTNLFWLFGGFILACGTVDLIEAIIFWHPIYRVMFMQMPTVDGRPAIGQLRSAGIEWPIAAEAFGGCSFRN